MKCPHCEKLLFIDVCAPESLDAPVGPKPSAEDLIKAADALDKVIVGKFGMNLIEVADGLRAAARYR